MGIQPTHIRLYGTVTDSIVDGPGLRYGVFTQGCPHACPGCHNPQSQIMGAGYEASIDDLIAEISAQKIIEGVTLSGGEPFVQPEACLVLAQKLKERGYNLWIYSGYRYEDIRSGNLGVEARALLDTCDVLVDGPFVSELHQYDLQWRGSSNQRVIDIPASAASQEIVWYKQEDEYPTPPPSW